MYDRDMKIIHLEPTGNAYKVICQDEKTGEAFTVGISNSLAMAWGKKTPEERNEALEAIARKLAESYSFKILNGQEKIYTTHDTEQDYELALPSIKWDFPR